MLNELMLNELMLNELIFSDSFTPSFLHSFIPSLVAEASQDCQPTTPLLVHP